jgi:hypothetical protein
VVVIRVCRRAPSGLLLKIDVGERLPVGVAEMKVSGCSSITKAAGSGGRMIT